MKKFATLGILLVILVLILTGCATENKNDENAVGLSNKSVELFTLDGKKTASAELVYDAETKILYYYHYGHYREYLSPYYNENGKMCRYDVTTGAIEEIN